MADKIEIFDLDDKLVGNGTYRQTIDIDLAQENPAPINIAPEWQIKVTRNKNIFNFFKIEKSILKKVYLSVGNIDIPNELEANTDEMLSVIIEGKSHTFTNLNKKVEYLLTSVSNSLSLFFNPSCIKDVSERQKKADFMRTVTFDVIVADENDAVICKYSVALDIKIKRLVAKPQVSTILVNRGRFDYRNIQGQKMKIGRLSIVNPAPFAHSPEINMLLEVKLFGPDKKEIEGLTLDETGKNEVSIKGLLSNKTEEVEGSEIIIPEYHDLTMDFGGIRNPLQPTVEYTIELSGYWTYTYEQGVRHPIVGNQQKLRINKDMQGTEMMVEINGEKVANGSTATVPLFKFAPAGEFGEKVELVLRNIATDTSYPKAGLYITDITCDTQEPDKNVALYKKDKRIFTATDIDNLVSIEGDCIDSITNGDATFVANGENALTKLTLRFDPMTICSVGNCKTHTFNMRSTVTIVHYANAEGKPIADLAPASFTFDVLWQFEVLPYPEWLCIDYGSSAIVCIYNNGIIDLNRIRKRQLSECDIDLDGQNEEGNTPFLPSEIIFNTVTDNAENSWLCGEKSAQNYNKYAVFLAPTKELVRQNYQRQLPCLKLLVGNAELPENPDYNAYSYNCLASKGKNVVNVSIKDMRESTASNSLAKVDVVFDETYKILFEKYIDSEIADRNRVNKLVLTYPNTYTPSHLKVLKKIATNTFPELRTDYLNFVSESDAVAAYYMSHWSEYNPDRDIHATERILVYDMGAGTLDLTLVEKSYDAKTDRYTLEILGKMGISKAGNYLDFVLAQIFSTRLAKTNRPSGAHADAIAKDRLELKYFVKNVLKPQLKKENSNNTIKFNSTEKTIGEILNHKLFQKYLDDCSKGILQRMRHYIGRDLKIDTVIMSGRSSRLEPLVDKLKEALGISPATPKQNSSENKQKSDSSKDRNSLLSSLIDRVENNESTLKQKYQQYFNKNEVKFIKLDTANEPDRQKTAVAYGAIMMAGIYSLPDSPVKILSRRLYASFGVGYKGVDGSYLYKELLSHTEIPYNNNQLISIISDEEDIMGIGATQEVLLVQSYLSETDTQLALKNNDNEYISIMNTYSLASFGGANTLTMRLELDKSNNIALCIYNSNNRNNSVARARTPRGIELDSEITRQSIWPVTI